MDAEKREIVEKKVYEDGRKEYASEGKGNAALALGIIGTALGAGALWGRGGSLFGGGSIPENVNINTAQGGNPGQSSPTAFQAWSKECDDVVALTNELWGLKLNTEREMYAHRETDVREKHELWRSQIAADFGLYKNQRDIYDALNEKYGEKFNSLDRKIAVMEATRPYQDRLIQCEIREALATAVGYTDRKTCRMITGAVVLPDSQQLSGYPSYCCASQQG